MSLDMDADLLITERAPVTSLIQRMGRCNRARTPRDNAGEVVIYTTENSRPYDDVSLTGVDQFLASIAGQARVSQSDLEIALAAIAMPEEIAGDCQFIGSAPFASSKETPFRDIDEFTTDAILERDVTKYHQVKPDKKHGYIVPVPRYFRARQPESATTANLPGHMIVAPSENYHEAIGFCDEPVRQTGGIIV